MTETVITASRNLLVLVRKYKRGEKYTDSKLKETVDRWHNVGLMLEGDYKRALRELRVTRD